MVETFDIEELLPYDWTPIGDMGVEYRIIDVCLTYEKDDFARWDGYLWLKCRGRQEYAEMRDRLLDPRAIRKMIFQRVYNYEKWLKKAKEHGY